MLRKIALGILIAGLAASAAIFVTTPPETDDDAGGVALASVENSKRYQRELERIGGKAAIAAVEFQDWFASLWHGRRLAGTVAVVAVGTALALLGLSRLPPPDE